MGALQPACARWHPLPANRTAFERAGVDIFSLQSEDLGPLTAVEVSHDGTGRSPAWYVNEVCVVQLNSSERYTFAFDCWLDERNSYSKCVEVQRGTRAACSYTVRVKVCP